AACCGLVGGQLCDACSGRGCQRCGGRGHYPMPGIEDTRSRHTFYDSAMPTSDGKGGILPPVDPVIEVQKHVQAVAERHAARHKAGVLNLEPLMKPLKGKKPQVLSP